MKRLLSILLCITLIFSLCTVPADAKSKKKKDNKKKTEKITKKNISVTTTKLADGILVTMKNKNKSDVRFVITLDYKAVNGDIVKTEDYEIQCLPKNKTAAYFFLAPLDDRGEYMSYDFFDYTVSGLKNSSEKSLANSLTILETIEPSKLILKCANTAPSSINLIKLCIVMYDASGNVIQVVNKTIGEIGSSEVKSFEIDYGGKATPASIKIYKNDVI